MCDTEDETRGADAIIPHGAVSQARSLKGESGTYSEGPVKQGWQTCARGYSLTAHRSGSFFVSLNTLYLYTAVIGA
jgi:hypothetical protein